MALWLGMTKDVWEDGWEGEIDPEYRNLVDKAFIKKTDMALYNSTPEHARYLTRKLLDSAKHDIRIFTGSFAELETLGVLEWLKENKHKLAKEKAHITRKAMFKYAVMHPIFTLKVLIMALKAKR